MSNPENQFAKKTQQTIDVPISPLRRKLIRNTIVLAGFSFLSIPLIPSCDNKPKEEAKTWLNSAENEELDALLKQIEINPLKIDKNGLQLLERKFMFYSLYSIGSKNPDIQRNRNVAIAYPATVIKLYTAAETGNYALIKDKNLLEKQFQNLLLNYTESIRMFYTNNFTLTSNPNIDYFMAKSFLNNIYDYDYDNDITTESDYLSFIVINYSRLNEKEAQVLADKMRQYTREIKKRLPGYKESVYSKITSQIENEANQIEKSHK